jgi:glycosyltransferase involved in cell wall biosynthesis
MIKVYCPSVTNGAAISGGFQFLNNLKKSSEKGNLFQIVNNWQDCDVVLITGATMTDRDEMYEAKRNGKKIVFRIDNMPKDSRNRGTAFSRMSDFAKIADFFIYQSNWAKHYVGYWIDKQLDKPQNYSIIYNGVDTDIFNYSDNPDDREDVYLFSQYNRDENKRFPEAAYNFHMIHRGNPRAKLFLVGQFSPELVANNFDFFDGEFVSYQGVITDRVELANIYRKCKYLLCPYYLDASPNTIAEAMACGLVIRLLNTDGGSLDVISNNFDESNNRPKIYSIDEMSKEYLKVFENLIK